LPFIASKFLGEICLLIKKGDYPVKKPPTPTNADFKNDDEKELAAIEYRAEYDQWSQNELY